MKYIHNDPVMTDLMLRAFFEQWITPIAFAIAVWWIIAKLKEIDRNGKRRDNSAKIMEIKVDAMAFAMSSAPPPLGAHFKEHYQGKVDERLREEKFIDNNN